MRGLYFFIHHDYYDGVLAKQWLTNCTNHFKSIQVHLIQLLYILIKCELFISGQLDNSKDFPMGDGIGGFNKKKKKKRRHR